MRDLSIEIAGLRLKNPLIVGAGPNTKSLPNAISCMKGGFGGIVVRSLHMQYPDQHLVPVREFWNIYGDTEEITKGLSRPLRRPNALTRRRRSVGEVHHGFQRWRSGQRRFER